METRNVPWWLAVATLTGGSAFASTLFVVGAADFLAIAVGIVLTGGGVAAALRRHALDVLPLELAPVVAVSDELKTYWHLRAWLGRGRRVDRVEFEALLDGEPLEVFVPPGPMVGRFQGVVCEPPHSDGSLEVVVRAWVGGAVQEARQHYLAADRRSGRFASGIGASMVWKRDEWSEVRGG